MPEEHGPWLAQLVARHQGLRVLVLRPHLDSRWYEASDQEVVELGLRYGVMDEGDVVVNRSRTRPRSVPAGGGVVLPALTEREAAVLRQVEPAARAVARRCRLEQRSLLMPRKQTAVQPFFVGGSGQGGSVALYAAVCVLQQPIRGVAFCLSGVPVAAMLAKRMSAQMRQWTKLYAIYDRADTVVPVAFAEALHRMLQLAGCDVTLEWLHGGDGHEFLDDAATQVASCASACLQPDFRSHAEAQAANLLREHPEMLYTPMVWPKAWNPEDQ